MCFKSTKNKSGFTLIELLVVISIIGLLTTVAVVGLNNAKRKSRDTRRMADIQQLRLALEFCQDNSGRYPTEAAGVTLGDAAHDCLNGSDGFTTSGCADAYMKEVPADPLSTGDYAYIYTSADGLSYQIDFYTESTVEGIDCTSGCTITPTGIQ
ncbi:prepilin-type N-terminal cleavage/methylation domain-containing protein [Patescibacteria group bacterium]|nr:prepilin-type N-terminal cleavage/methylation domain-containing protein [Patescibacteria group bacterium]MBU4512294.1 prepilin-type N-terminal cleavage/methylation domain-containing protein [Patescibacteria group bacterium]MCG2693648.1 prepilin-type N-terminal cleavage/methylation domain-containing protein [Candidatus Parcubacteria bacterium]